MKLSDFDYELPEELIAQEPLPDREGSRMLVLPREEGEVVHGHFRDLPRYLRPGDRLVLNDTRVMPARLLGQKVPTGGRVEILLLEQRGEDLWEAMVRPGRRLRQGSEVSIGDGRLRCRIEGSSPAGYRLVRFFYAGDFEALLRELGETPLPPYIHKPLEDGERYQTVYARREGSAAAPTAGLHFTLGMLERLKASGIGLTFITLHVGAGTFRPVKSEDPTEHEMHEEYFEVSEAAAREINETPGRVVAVGTTVVRALESAADETGAVRPMRGRTDLFIYPGYRFRVIEGLLTNFHLPRSTLLMLVAAFVGRERMLDAYREAVERRYRFYSFGDCMLII